MKRVVFLICLLSSASVAQSTVTICDLLTNTSKYQGKVVHVRGLMDAYFESWWFYPDHNCKKQDVVAFTTDEEFQKLNDTDTREKFDTAMNTLPAIQDQKKDENRACCVLRTEITFKGIFEVSNKPKFGRFAASKYLFVIRQIEDMGHSRLIEVGSSEYLDR